MSPSLYLTLVWGSYLYGCLLLACSSHITPEFKFFRGMCEGAGWAYLVAAVLMAWLLGVAQ